MDDLQNWVGELKNQVDDLQNQMDDLQIEWVNWKIEWANWKMSGRIENWMDELKIEWVIYKSSGRIASHTPLRQLADFAPTTPTTEPKTTDFQLNKYEKISIIFTPYIGIFTSNRPESFAKEQREICA